MDELVITDVIDDDMMEILPPEPTTCAAGMSSCDCCGRDAVMDEDCCGICEECLSP
jgi:hypothetical protein